MRCRTSLNANQARLKRGKEPQYVGSPQPLTNDNSALVVDTVSLKHILCDIEADPDRGHGDLSLNNAVPPILSEPGSAVAEGVHPIWIRTSSTRARSIWLSPLLCRRKLVTGRCALSVFGQHGGGLSRARRHFRRALCCCRG